MEHELILPQLWGGVECTINRVGDGFHDQLKRSDHLSRVTDIDRFAALGISALRVPVMWELTCDDVKGTPDFRKVEPMLSRIRAQKMGVVAGLCHHGSGPRGTDLLDPRFEHGLARYAQLVAEAFPWIEDYTPVNEPLTTARFSALYGHWYPHARDTSSFLRALVHQCRAVVLCMRAVRSVQPNARLVQTEDTASVRSSPGLRYQAEYENARRFLSLDLLSGRVNAQHPLHNHLLAHGINETELAWFIENACPPDIIGINYYVTSDRYLDEDLQRHPASTHGGNGRVNYADVDAARAQIGIVGHRDVIRTLWDRYGTPLAITEVHAGCTREEQLRWLHEAWRAACEARAQGVDVRAVTAWALLGSFDWNSLVCVEAGLYEPGVFDLRGAAPRPTALAQMITKLSHEGSYDHPVLSSPGWWHRNQQGAVGPGSRPMLARHILITGGSGSLAQAFSRACEVRGLAYRVLHRDELDVADPDQVQDALESLGPWAVVDAAGYARQDDVAHQPAPCLQADTFGPPVLADQCRQQGRRFLTFSSDLVFDGASWRPYVESDLVRPVCTDGTSHLRAERSVLQCCPEALVVRTSALFGPWDSRNPMTQALVRLTQGFPVQLCGQAIVSPTYLPHLVDACLDLLIDGAASVWHLANRGAVTWAEVVHRAAVQAHLPGDLITPVPERGGSQDALRPAYRALGSERSDLMPSIEEALARYLGELRMAQSQLGLLLRLRRSVSA